MQESASTVVENATSFLTVMSALSAAVQQLVEHVVKKRSDWLNVATPQDPTHEGRRGSAIHLISFIIGALLCWSVELKPLQELGLGSEDAAGSVLWNALIAGVLVSFGSSFFDEALGAVREWKKAQEKVRTG